MTTTTLLFRTGHAPFGGERDFVAALQNIVMTPELALEYARPVICHNDACRIGVLTLVEGQLPSTAGWRIKRHHRFEDMPKGAFFEHLPGTARDIVDDMDVEINLGPWVAVIPE